MTPLTIRRVAIDTFRENVAYLHRDCTVVRAEGFQALSKVDGQRQRHRPSSRCSTWSTTNASSARRARPERGGLRAPGRGRGPAAQRRSMPSRRPRSPRCTARSPASGCRATTCTPSSATSPQARYSKIELAAFVVATNQFELDRDEVLHLTEAMIAAGRRLDWQHEVRGGPVVDKHCIGGIPGNRTSMLVVPIVAAHGMLIPKTSSRAITSPAGTADTMEVLAEVELPLRAAGRRSCASTSGCLAWGGTADLSPADDMLISVERPLAHRLAGADGGVDPVEEDRRRLHAPGARHPGRPERQGARHARGAAAEEAVRVRGRAPAACTSTW